MSKKRGGFGSFIATLAIGAGIGMLLSPDNGENNRKALKAKIDELYKKVKGLDLNEVKDEMLDKIEVLKSELNSLDKEKVKEVALSQAQVIKVKAEELYRLAVEKGTPVLESATDEIRKQAIKVVKELQEKLEEEKPVEKKKTKKTTK